jgi:hypothetical protein
VALIKKLKIKLGLNRWQRLGLSVNECFMHVVIITCPKPTSGLQTLTIFNSSYNLVCMSQSRDAVTSSVTFRRSSFDLVGLLNQ